MNLVIAGDFTGNFVLLRQHFLRSNKIAVSVPLVVLLKSVILLTQTIDWWIILHPLIFKVLPPAMLCTLWSVIGANPVNYANCINDPPPSVGWLGGCNVGLELHYELLPTIWLLTPKSGSETHHHNFDSQPWPSSLEFNALQTGLTLLLSLLFFIILLFINALRR